MSFKTTILHSAVVMFTQATMRILNEMLSKLSYNISVAFALVRTTIPFHVQCLMFMPFGFPWTMQSACVTGLNVWKDSNKKKVNRERRFPILLGWFVQIRKLHLNTVAAFRIFKEVERMIWFGNKLRMHHANQKEKW